MFPVSQFPKLIADIPLYVAALAIILTAVLSLVINSRRLALLFLLVQYASVALLANQYLFAPLVLVRLATGCVVCGLLYLSAQRARRVLGDARDQEANAVASGGVNLAFRVVLAALCVLLSFDLWQRYHFYGVLQDYGLALLVMMNCALMMILVSTDLLRRGIGLVMVLHGASVFYLYLEQSFLAIVLLNALDVLIALAIAHLVESWLRKLEVSEA